METASNGTSVGSAATHPRLVVVGVGINIARPEAAAVSALASPDAVLPAIAPAGLSEVLVGLTAGEVLARVAPALVRDIQAFESQGFSAFAERFARRDALQGQSVRLSDGSQGTACGVSPQGALLVQTDQGMQTVTSSEVSVRPC
ncbi:Bifunctional ligase/repressor BirA [compost metagenome]